jgi:hypothetical protein
MALPDISSRFKFRQWTQGGYFYKEAAGELGVPGEVMTHRDESAQEELSGGTGEHAGHMIAVQFGAPGGIENMGLQNANMNTYAPRALREALRGNGASYYKLETDWKRKLKEKPPWRISVVVQDKYHVGENRPFYRWVQYVETTPQGKKLPAETRIFGNFSSQQLRDARGEKPGPVTNNGQGATVTSMLDRLRR